MTDCPRCAHDLLAHGAGCTIGWFGKGGTTDPCHCPNDDDGELAVTCAWTVCGRIGTLVDSMGQFYCDTHQEGVHIDQVTSWT